MLQGSLAVPVIDLIVLVYIQALPAHVRSVHTGERPFSCLMCDRSFVRRNDLKVHERTHDLVEEQTCQRCGSVFKREHYLKKHARTCNGIAPPLQVAKQRRAECNKKAPKKKVVVVPQAARRIMPDRSTKRRRE